LPSRIYAGSRLKLGMQVHDVQIAPTRPDQIM
jgi:hypothetical protein